MDLMQTGKFIAALRKEQGLTQEQLGEKIGVTNKTVSRWETGTYLPPADALLALSELFAVSINELLSGRRLSAEEYREAAEENLTRAIGESSFTLKEKIEFYKRKWLKEHVAAMCLWGTCVIAVFAACLILKKSYLGFAAAALMLIVGHGWRNNAMMAYVERNAFDGSGVSQAPYSGRCQPGLRGEESGCNNDIASRRFGE